MGFPFNGSAPDLGAFESNYITSIVSSMTNPDEFQLFQNFPNPFNPSTNISYNLGKSERVTLSIFNSLGKQIVTLLNGEYQTGGLYMVTWDGNDNAGMPVASGVYFYQIELASGMRSTKKMFLLK